MKLVNLTPHRITIVPENGVDPLVLEPDPVPARVSTVCRQTGSIRCHGHAVPVVVELPTGTTGLPQPRRDTAYVVSAVVATANPDRLDLLVPANLLRNPDGSVSGCQWLRATTADATAEDGLSKAPALAR